jgi:hypothetical protein
MDDARQAMTRMRALALAATVGVVASGHVGSPTVFFDGHAGPYPVRVVVRPPMVVPGRAQVSVRVTGDGVERVIVRPVYWRAGTRGAPEGDPARPVRGEAGTYAGELWLMQHGAYSVYVTVAGTRGSGEAIVPVMSVATGRLGLAPGLGAVLLALGTVLLAGLVTIVRAAAAESVLVPGAVRDRSAIRRGRVGALVALPVLAFALFGGARWWQAVDDEYERSMYVPWVTEPRVELAPDAATMSFPLAVGGSAVGGRLMELVPDHGKIAHAFLVASDLSAIAHLHPVRRDAVTMHTGLPPLPAGRYHLFVDIVTETGSQHTVTGTTDLPPIPSASPTGDADDGFAVGLAAAPVGAGARVTLADGATIGWTGPTELIARKEIELRFAARAPDGSPAVLEPYLGMAGHAVVMRHDASVFVHLHPMGTVPVAAQQVFTLRDRGDTTAGGELLDRGEDLAPAHDAMHGELAFPYEFPREGRYRIFVQVKRNGRVLTGAFDATVRDAP